MDRVKKLTDLATGSRGVIRRIAGKGAFKRRLMEMGFLAGNEIYVRKYAPLEDPGEYVIGANHISLRRSEAENIYVSVRGPDGKGGND